jgi:hypothetical protein
MNFNEKELCASLGQAKVCDFQFASRGSDKMCGNIVPTRTHAKVFRLISGCNNAISYPTDKGSLEWTFTFSATTSDTRNPAP